MRLRVLGTLELVDGSVAAGGTEGAVALRSPKLRRLLAALLVRPGAVVSVDRLGDILWGDAPPANMEASLHNLVSRLRGVLRRAGASPTAPVAVLTRAPGYRVEVPREAVDATCFEDLVARARSLLPDQPGQAAGLLDEALALWRGPAYAEFADEDFARAEAARLEELRAAAAEDRVDAALALGGADEAVVLLEPLTVDHPLRERPHRQLMLALYRLGRQADALRAYREYRSRLDEELGLEPSLALQRLEADLLRQDSKLDWSAPVPPPEAPATPRSTEGAPSNLPPAPAGLVGRDDELRTVGAMVGAARVVTLTGPGGVGKTSLALHVAYAARAGGGFEDGVWLVELAAVTDKSAVADTVTTILGIQQRHGLTVAERLVEYLRPKRLLLVLDNCEHVVDVTAPLVDGIVRSCPQVTVLATSREPLGVDCEHVRPVPPLSVPPATATDVAGTASVHAVTLFVERATAAASGFVLTDGNAAAVGEICRRLDGMPLAIELAATRMRSMSPAEVAERLSSRFRFLRSTKRVAAERHRTLRAVVDWSYGLLDEDERRVFDRVSVFAAGFPLEAAEQVAAGDKIDKADVVDLLAGLVDRSMVVATPGDPDGTPTRYALLETLRAYGRERLAERGEIDAARRDHAAYHVAFVEAAAPRLHGPEVVRWAEAVSHTLDELRAAHAWALDHDLDLAVRLVAALFDYVDLRMAAEVAIWAERTVQAVQASGSTHPLVSIVYAVAAGGARFRGDLTHAAALAQRGLAAATDEARRRFPLYILSETTLAEGRLEDAERMAAELERLALAAGDTARGTQAALIGALVHAYSGDVDRAVALAEQTRERAERSDSPVEIAWSRYLGGEVLLETDPERAGALLDEAAARARALGDRFLAGVALVSAASVHGRHGDPHRALLRFREVVEHWHQAGNWTHQWTTIRNVVELLVRVAADEQAAVLLGAVTSRLTGAPTFGADADRLAKARLVLTERLGRQSFRAAADRGAAMTDDGVVAYAAGALDQHAGRGS